MIIGRINNSNNVLLKNNKYFNDAARIIDGTDFSKIDDGKYYIEDDDFFYFLITYETKGSDEKPSAEVHKNYIDFHYILYGEELIGYSDTDGRRLITKDYDSSKDVEFLDYISDENYFVLKKGMFVVFYPYEIHRSGLSNNTISSIRKVVFKIKCYG